MSTDDRTFTVQCDACRSVFRVQPQHLSAAQGWMQCGVCGHVFRAERPPQLPAAVPAPEPTPTAEAHAVTVDTPDSGVTASSSTAGETVAQTAADSAPPPIEVASSAEAEAAGPPTLPGLAQRMVEPEATAPVGPKLESIILVDPDIPAGDPGPLPTFAEEETPAPPVIPLSPTPEKPASATESNWIPRQAVEAPRPRPRRSASWLWAVLALPLLIALPAQLIYFLRDEIAVRYPEFRPPLAEMCRVVDCKLGLPRDAKQVQILGSDLQTEGPGNLALVLTLANRARHAMAWPVLELTLTDVKDQALGRRVFAPSEYLPSPEMEAAGIPPLTEVPLTLKLQTKEIKAVGYRLKMFY